MVKTLWELYGERYEVYEAPPTYPAYCWSPEKFIEVIRTFVLKCKAYPTIRTRVSFNRRIEYNGLPAIYLIPWGGTDECQTVIFYGVPEDLWVLMDVSEGEWKAIYRRLLEQLGLSLTDEDRAVLSFEYEDAYRAHQEQ